MTSNPPPIHAFALGNIHTTIFENESEATGRWYVVEISRHYQIGKQKRQTHLFRRDDLPIVAKAAEMAYAWLWQQNGLKESPNRSSE